MSPHRTFACLLPLMLAAAPCPGPGRLVREDRGARAGRQPVGRRRRRQRPAAGVGSAAGRDPGAHRGAGWNGRRLRAGGRRGHADRRPGDGRRGQRRQRLQRGRAARVLRPPAHPAGRPLRDTGAAGIESRRRARAGRRHDAARLRRPHHHERPPQRPEPRRAERHGTDRARARPDAGQRLQRLADARRGARRPRRVQRACGGRC